MNRDGLVAPGIFKPTAAVGDIHELHTQFARGVFKAACLIAELGGKEQQPFGRIMRVKGQGPSIQTNDSVCGRDSFGLAMGTNWSRVGSAQQYQGSLR